MLDLDFYGVVLIDDRIAWTRPDTPLLLNGIVPGWETDGQIWLFSSMNAQDIETVLAGLESVGLAPTRRWPEGCQGAVVDGLFQTSTDPDITVAEQNGRSVVFLTPVHAR